jgi:hypothetical protein
MTAVLIYTRLSTEDPHDATTRPALLPRRVATVRKHNGALKVNFGRVLLGWLEHHLAGFLVRDAPPQ